MGQVEGGAEWETGRTTRKVEAEEKVETEEGRTDGLWDQAEGGHPRQERGLEEPEAVSM